MSETTIEHEWRGSHSNNTGHPEMDDTKIIVHNEAREQLRQIVLDRPGVKYVEYFGPAGDKNATTGWAYYYKASSEVPTFSDEKSHTEAHKWTGTVTCHLLATFEKEHLG